MYVMQYFAQGSEYSDAIVSDFRSQFQMSNSSLYMLKKLQRETFLRVSWIIVSIELILVVVGIGIITIGPQYPGLAEKRD